MDDIVRHAATQRKHAKILTQVLQICEDNNLKLNREKTHLCKKEVEYVGHIFSADGIKICSKRIEYYENAIPKEQERSHDNYRNGDLHM